MSKKLKRVFPEALFVQIVEAEVKSRGYNDEEAAAASGHLLWCAQVQEWSRTLAKFMHMDDVTGSKVGGWVPGAQLDRLFPTNGRATPRRIYYANGQLGLLSAQRGVDEACELAEIYGLGQIDITGAAHLMCAGHWAYQIAQRGYIARVSCTSGTVEAAPHGGKKRTIGPNPFAEAYPTQDALGFIMMIDTSATAYSMGKVAATRLEGKSLPPGVAIDENGEPLTDVSDPKKPVILTFGESPTTSHKLYGLAMGIELGAAFAGSSLPTLRGRRGTGPENEEYRSHFRIVAEVPAGKLGGKFPMGRSMKDNVEAVYDDITTPNKEAHTPGKGKSDNMKLTELHGGLLMSEAQVREHTDIAATHGIQVPALKEVEV